MKRYANPLVDARRYRGLLLERWAYEAGPPASIERHVHEEYQVGIALDLAGVYDYRRRTEPVPLRQLVIVHPGEPHAVRDTAPRPAAARYMMAYIDPVWLTEPFGIDGGGASAELPFFDDAIADRRLVAWFLRIFRAAADPLELECRLVGFAGRLRTMARGARPALAPDPGAPVQRVREMLHDDPFADTSLDKLARAAGLSPWHLLRAFEDRFGLPPHRYRRMLRIEAARERMAAGEPLARVALRAGFYDQSHFGRHFRRIIGTTPSRYRISSVVPAASNSVL